LLARLGGGGTEYRVLTALESVHPDGASLMNVTTGEVDEFVCELVVVQTGRASRSALIETLRKAGIETHAVGDCIAPRRVSHALFEGHRVARGI
jgi:2,4-dienoyl-CoA reductase (NADPH2)